MNEVYLTPYSNGEAEFVEKHSRFIGQVCPVSTEAEALSFIKSVKDKQAGARHNPFAYIIKNEGYMRYSDDGEPKGTAGMPILEVFRREGITDFCCVVTRYFGGVLLGAAGLTRAYAKAAKMGLDAAGISEMKLLSEITLQFPYRFLDMLRIELQKAGGIEQDADFGKDVCLRVLISAESYDSFISRVLEITGGAASVLKHGEKYLGMKIK